MKDNSLADSVVFCVSVWFSSVLSHTTTQETPGHTPFVGVFDEQAGQQRLGVGGQRAGELDVLHEDELEQLLVVLVVERQPAAHHLVRHHTQTPPVHRPPVVVVLQDLRRGDKTQIDNFYFFFSF